MIGSISLLTWGLLFGSVCSLEAWDDILDFLLLTKKKKKKQNMEEIDIKICMKKAKKN